MSGKHPEPEDSISRAYYCVLHAAKAALNVHGIDPDSHEGVKRMFGLYLVKPGHIDSPKLHIACIALM